MVGGPCDNQAVLRGGGLCREHKDHAAQRHGQDGQPDDGIGAEAVAACRALAEENGLRLRVRAMIENS